MLHWQLSTCPAVDNMDGLGFSTKCIVICQSKKDKGYVLLVVYFIIRCILTARCMNASGVGIHVLRV